MGKIILTDTETLLQLPVKRRDVVVRDSDSEYTYSNDDDTQPLSGSRDFYLFWYLLYYRAGGGFYYVILRRTC